MWEAAGVSYIIKLIERVEGVEKAAEGVVKL